MPTDLTLAIAGHEPNSKRNIESLLSDYLFLGTPDKKGYYERPDRFATITVYVLMTDGAVPLGVRDAANLLLSIDGARVHLVTDEVTGDIIKWADYVDDVSEVADPLEYLVSKLSAAPSARLLMNWDESDADDDQLIKLAHQHPSIRVLDLVQGLGDILPDVEDAPDPEPEEEEPEPPVSRTRKRRKPEVEELEEPREELEEEPPSTSSPEKSHQEAQEAPQVSAPSTLEDDVASAKRTQTTLPLADTTIPTETLITAHKALDKASGYLIGIDQGNALKNLASEAIPSPLTLFVVEAAEALRAVLFAEVTYEKSLTKSEKSAVKPGKVIWDEEANEWKRAGRGRVRVGTRTGVMDAAGNVTEDA